MMIWSSAVVTRLGEMAEPPSMPGPHECKFILDNGPWRRRPPQWCGKRTLADSPYCREHHDRCYTTRPHRTGSK